MKKGFTLSELIISIAILVVVITLILQTSLDKTTPSVKLMKIQTHETCPSGW